ncbi:hypothetical protein EJ08DRAFT_659233 [Tothia fuscella]|uniref:Uncharacterized protein n=1 Tax=Tothia fuscella TaxID=1048955 RepID=A0A9P4NW35_9PEZI|nr:hypothetical protein EJ08DRAFT_659233 [Tothia fuscella]
MDWLTHLDILPEELHFIGTRFDRSPHDFDEIMLRCALNNAAGFWSKQTLQTEQLHTVRSWIVRSSKARKADYTGWEWLSALRDAMDKVWDPSYLDCLVNLDVNTSTSQDREWESDEVVMVNVRFFLDCCAWWKTGSDRKPLSEPRAFDDGLCRLLALRTEAEEEEETAGMIESLDVLRERPADFI